MEYVERFTPPLEYSCLTTRCLLLTHISPSPGNDQLEQILICESFIYRFPPSKSSVQFNTYIVSSICIQENPQYHVCNDRFDRPSHLYWEWNRAMQGIRHDAMPSAGFCGANDMIRPAPRPCTASLPPIPTHPRRFIQARSFIYLTM